MGFTCLASTTTGHRQRWLGRPKKEVAKAALESWNLCEDVVPEQGLWLLYEGDNEAVFINREEILEACGLDVDDGVQWGFQREDFGWEDEILLEEEAMGSEDEDVEDVGMGKRQRTSSDRDEDMGVMFHSDE